MKTATSVKEYTYDNILVNPTTLGEGRAFMADLRQALWHGAFSYEDPELGRVEEGIFTPSWGLSLLLDECGLAGRYPTTDPRYLSTTWGPEGEYIVTDELLHEMLAPVRAAAEHYQAAWECLHACEEEYDRLTADGWADPDYQDPDWEENPLVWAWDRYGPGSWEARMMNEPNGSFQASRPEHYQTTAGLLGQDGWN